jgi:hypothetical protein
MYALKVVEVVMRKLLGMAVLCVAFAGVASADGRWGGHDGYTDKVAWNKDVVGVASAPEMDPASALSALTLLVGGVAVMRGRRK